MSRLVEMTGRRFGRLRVIERRGGGGAGRPARWLCECDCGTQKVLDGRVLRRGATRSCGCYCREAASARARTHGMTGTRTHNSWESMRERTTWPESHPKYRLYGGKGVTVCDRWRDSFEAFLEDMGERPAGTTLDRINPDGNYEPGNCRWATPLVQRHNRSARGRA